MAKLVWNQTGQKFYETGLEKGVLYPFSSENGYTPGVAWSGLTSVSENPSGAEATKLYADNNIYLTLTSIEEFGATIEAYTCPDEFAACDGTTELTAGVSIGQQPRTTFGLCYQTKLGNDTENEKYGYKLHLVYGCKASPSDKSYNTINDSPEANTLSWEVTTTPVDATIDGVSKTTATVVIDSTKVSEKALKAIEDVLYGTEDAEARLPLPDEVASIIKNAVAAG